MIFYRVVHTMVIRAIKMFARVEVLGAEHLPRSGAYLLVPSHRSMADIPLLAVLTRRRIRFMGKASLFRILGLGRIFRALGSFPVERDGSDRAALRAGLDLLEIGEILVVFPEGTRCTSRQIQPLQPGAAYLAIKAGVPLIPVGLAGSEELGHQRRKRFGRRCRVVIAVGEPIPSPSRSGSVVPRALVNEHIGVLATRLEEVFAEAYSFRDRLHESDLS